MISGKKLVDAQILLVEDEPACRHTIETILDHEGASVTIAENAEEAVKLMQSPGFDIVVSDIKLPGMNGISLLSHIRKINPNLPVIMMTGYSSIDSAVEALKLGAQDYLIKPLGDGAQVINAVWKSLEHYRLALKNKSLQEQLKQSEETFRTLFHNASDAIFLNRLEPNGHISTFSEVNAVACSRLGYSRKELQSMTLLDITAMEHREDTARVMETLPEREHTTFEAIHLSKDGKRMPVEISAHMFSLKGNNAVLSIARNITERREMEKQITEASEKESRHIGQELHDVLCQDLASIKMLTSVLKTTLESESSKGIHDAELIRDMASNAVTCTRRLCAGLFPSELENAGLASALEHLAINQEQLFHIPCSFTNKCIVEVPDKSVALHLYRIAQQAINNAVLHSKAKCISISLAQKGSGVILTVNDDGIGITSVNNNQNEGMGLHIMKYRARIIGAVLIISRRSNGGTTVECIWQ
ncbi:MAG: response regulator [Kiritimatiellae bacterium]|nr:response regulator [Kiritimatiellia bacterium]MDD5520634.1 response regulator [Kiritimatiellia bacterium]